MSVVQPLGAFPLPAGLLLVPEDGDAELLEAIEALGAGRLPTSWPPALEAHRLAHADEPQAAHDAIADTDAFAVYNRYVLDPDAHDPAAALASLPARLAPLVDLVRFTAGETEEPPAVAAETDAVVVALALSAQAAHRLAHDDATAAISVLREGADLVEHLAPPLAWILRGNAATIAYEQTGEIAAPQAELSAAAAALAGTDLAISRAELHYQLGTIAHESAAASGGSMQGAMHHYYTALQSITREDAPYLWASAQMNLSAAYLAEPMSEASDSLRMGIAIQALRASLEVFTRESHPSEWATATLNLANALVYTPSVKQGDNLVEAVELYEEVLAVRDRMTDPLGRARVLTNQGNALAHLGVLDQATAKLYEARFLFEEQLDHDGALTVRGLLDEVARHSLPEHGRDGGGRLAMAGNEELRPAPDDRPEGE